jgi:hypothetical protein
LSLFSGKVWSKVLSIQFCICSIWPTMPKADYRFSDVRALDSVM